jgi:hypothetical protein
MFFHFSVTYKDTYLKQDMLQENPSRRFHDQDIPRTAFG